MSNLDQMLETFAQGLREENERQAMRDEAMRIEAEQSTIDQRLKKLEQSDNYYKSAAARNLLRLRHMRRWHKYNKGKLVKLSTMLEAVAICRERAMGKNLPNVVIIGGPK